MVTVAHLDSGICKDLGFAPASVHLVFFVLSASETGLLFVVKLGRNVVMMRAGVKIMHQDNFATAVKLPSKKKCALMPEQKFSVGQFGIFISKHIMKLKVAHLLYPFHTEIHN